MTPQKEDPTRWAEFGPCRGALRLAKVTLDSVKPLRVRRIDNSRQKLNLVHTGRRSWGVA